VANLVYYLGDILIVSSMKKNVVKEKSYDLAIRIVKLCQLLQKQKNEFVLSKQLLRSGTAPGALIREAEHAESKKDFIHKMSIGLKEINETEYWIRILFDTGYITKQEFDSIHADVEEVLKLFISIVKKSKTN